MIPLSDIPRGAKLVYPDGSVVTDISANTLRQYAFALAAEPIIADYLEHMCGPAAIEEATCLAIPMDGHRYLGAKLVLGEDDIDVLGKLVLKPRQGVSVGIAERFTEKQIAGMSDVMTACALKLDEHGNVPFAKICGEWGEVIGFLDEEGHSWLCLLEELPDDVMRLCKEAEGQP